MKSIANSNTANSQLVKNVVKSIKAAKPRQFFSYPLGGESIIKWQDKFGFITTMQQAFADSLVSIYH